MDRVDILLIGGIIYVVSVLITMRKEKKFLISWLIASIFQLTSIYYFSDIANYIIDLNILSFLDVQLQFWICGGIVILSNLLVIFLVNLLVFSSAISIKRYKGSNAESKLEVKTSRKKPKEQKKNITSETQVKKKDEVRKAQLIGEKIWSEAKGYNDAKLNSDFEIVELTLNKIRDESDELSQTMEVEQSHFTAPEDIELGFISENDSQESINIEMEAVEEVKTLDEMFVGQSEDDFIDLIENMIQSGKEEEAERYLRILTYYSKKTDVAQKAQNMLSELSVK